MIKLGLRIDHLGTPWLTWRDLKVILKHVDSDSPLSRAVHPETWPWFDLGNRLSAGILNAIAQQIHLSHGRGTFEPPVRLPVAKIKKSETKRKVQGSTITEIDAWLKKRRASGKL